MINLKNIAIAGIDSLVGNIDKLIDHNFTSDEERLTLKNELKKISQVEKLKIIDSSDSFEKDITNRWLSDNENIITRLVRPMILIYLYILFGVVVLFDGNIGNFTINQAYIPVLETLTVSGTIAYFGSRGFEKVSKK